MDCGAEENYIDPRVVNRLQLPWKDKDEPYIVENLEGEEFQYEDGRITREIDHLKVFVEGRNQGISFDIIPMRRHDIVLGYPWLYQQNPDINWRTGQLNFTSSDYLDS